MLCRGGSALSELLSELWHGLRSWCRRLCGRICVHRCLCIGMRSHRQDCSRNRCSPCISPCGLSRNVLSRYRYLIEPSPFSGRKCRAALVETFYNTTNTCCLQLRRNELIPFLCYIVRKLLHGRCICGIAGLLCCAGGKNTSHCLSLCNNCIESLQLQARNLCTSANGHCPNDHFIGAGMLAYRIVHIERW